MGPLIDFAYNFTLLLALTFLYSFVYPLLARFSRRVIDIINGLLFGTFALISMLQPITIAPGIFYDGRTIVIAIAGFYGGPIPALIAAAMASVFRLWLGGAGTLGGIGSAISAALLSIVVRSYILRRGQWRPTKPQLILIGVALPLINGFWTLTVSNFDVSILSRTLPYTLLIYPLALLLLGTLLASQRQQRRIEQALRESEHRYRALFDSSFELIGVLKPDGTVIEANRTTLEFFGLRLNQIVGRPIWEVIPFLNPDNVAYLKAAVAETAAGGSSRFEGELAAANQQTIIIDFSLKPVLNEQGQVVLLVPEGHDITERQHYESQKLDLAMERERSSVLKKFISDVSHDFRTPLSVIRLNLELLQRTNDPAQQQKRIGVLLRETDRLTSLLDDMKMMLHLDDEAALEFIPVDANNLMQGVVETQRVNAEANQQTLNMDFVAEELTINAADELQRALSNIIVNAISYTPKGGTITVTTRTVQSSLEIEVRDTGIGIDADDLPRIFQRFYRADQARSIHTGGTGLGLAISKKIIEAHGGSITVESTPDVGSTFRVRLPLLAQTAPATLKEAAAG